MKKQVILYGLYTIIAGAILYIAFFKVIQYPEHYLFGNGGDGLKNYFTFVDYVKHGHGTHFTGMNYPYGEHVIFTDNQPAYAFFFHWINHNIIDISNNLVGIYNLILIFSIFLSGLFILKIMKFFKLPDWYAITFSIMIMFLSPQLLRLPAHFTLSYGFYIPAIWYYLLRIFDKNSKPVHYAGLGIIFLLSSFTHLYFFAINLMMIFVFSFFALLYFKKKVLIKTLKTIGLTTILMLFVILFIKLSDNIKDRPPNPWGIDYYNASFESIFLPHSGFLFRFLNVGNQQFEGIAYVGIIGLIFSAVFIIYLIYILINNSKLIKIHFSSKKITEDKLLTVSMLTGIITVLYATHFLHKIDIFGITRHLGSFGQFRSIGRFAWIFYYIYTVFFSYYIYKYFDDILKRGKNLIAFLSLIFVIVIWSNEAKQNFSEAVEHIFNKNEYLINNDKTYLDILEKGGKSPSNFQAILQLPLVVVGPEKWVREKGQWIMGQTFKCSFQTGLPIMDIMMSRTSLIQSLDLVQIIGSLPIQRQRLKSMDDRPLLLICNTSETSKEENILCKKGILLGENNELKILELPIDSIRSKKNIILNRINTDIGVKDSIYLEERQGYVFIENFENEKSPVSFNDKGAKLFKDTTVFCTEIPKDTQIYEISLWLYFDPSTIERPVLNYYYYNKETSGKSKLSINNMTDTKGYWIRLSINADPGFKYCIKIEGKSYIDAIMIKPANSHLIQIKNNNVFYDNCELLYN